ncbi:O-antigen ligase family protein [Stutzerimonas kunmingensis]|uniref:O-antigen ligase family protein n=1 Tax=Stutzerimonas kunmingensis TaxID=1211807 RepID=UPI0037D72F1C
MKSGSACFIFLFMYFFFIGRRGLSSFADDAVLIDLVAVMSILLLFICIRWRRLSVPYSHTMLFTAMFFLFMFSLPGLFEGEVSMLAIDKACRVFLIWLFCVALVFTHSEDIKVLSRLALALCVIPLFYILQKIFLSDEVRSGFSGAGAITTARLIMYIAFVNAWLAYNKSGNLSMRVVFILLLSGIAIAFTESRAVFLSFLVFCLISCFVAFSKKRQIALFVFMAAVGGALLYYAQDSRIVYRLTVLMEEGGGSSVQARVAYMSDALGFAKDYDYLGSGIGSYGYLAHGEAIFDYPHNLIVEIILEFGVFGLLALFVFLVIAFMKLIEVDFMALLIWLVALFNSFVSGDIYDNRLVFVLPFFFIYMARLMDAKKSTTKYMVPS